MNSKKEILVVWEYKVKPEFVEQFVSAYSSDGNWANLFKTCPGYIKTELKRDLNDGKRFITIDYWQSYSEFLAMKQQVKERYENLDNKCECFTLSELLIGIFLQ